MSCPRLTSGQLHSAARPASGRHTYTRMSLSTTVTSSSRWLSAVPELEPGLGLAGAGTIREHEKAPRCSDAR